MIAPNDTNPHHPDHKKDHAAAQAGHGAHGGHAHKIRNHDRRPKGARPMCRRTISLSSESNRLAENEAHRRGLPSVSAFIEHAISKEARHKERPEEVDLLHVIDEMRLALHRLERESAERDVIQVELLAGLARTQFATFPTPPSDERPARIAHANEQFEKLLDAVGRRIESGQTTLSQIPDPLPPDAPAAPEENLSPGEDDIDVRDEQV